MSYVFLVVECFKCGRRFGCNPNLLPLFSDSQGVRKPVCQACLLTINGQRILLGRQPFEVSADAYEASDENDLFDK